MIIGMRHEIKGVIVVFVPAMEAPKATLLGVQNPLLALKVTVMIHVCKDSRVVDGNKCHLDDVGERVIVSELCEILSSMD
jgi:hypothetical protein